MIYAARTAAGLTQKQLADLIGTQQSTTVARLEDADYEGHSLSMLRRIAEALNKRLVVRFSPGRAAWFGRSVPGRSQWLRLTLAASRPRDRGVGGGRR
jgi:transcriptional regulator with XRE-family HTH domain